MAGLRQEFRRVGFNEGDELPDHLRCLLRFIGKCDIDSTLDELLSYCLIPALKSMASALAKTENPYALLLSGIQHFLDAGRIPHLVETETTKGGKNGA